MADTRKKACEANNLNTTVRGGGGDMVANECYTPYCLNYVCSTFVAVNAGERAKIKHNRYVRGWNHISWDENKNQ